MKLLSSKTHSTNGTSIHSANKQKILPTPVGVSTIIKHHIVPYSLQVSGTPPRIKNILRANVNSVWCVMLNDLRNDRGIYILLESHP